MALMGGGLDLQEGLNELSVGLLGASVPARELAREPFPFREKPSPLGEVPR